MINLRMKRNRKMKTNMRMKNEGKNDEENEKKILIREKKGN